MPPLPSPEELEASLWGDLLDRWFPACIDPAGGYRQSFDAGFRPTGDRTKGLVFQSRMVWVCATVASLRPEFGDYARHGVRFLLDRLDGGLAWSVDADGTHPEERHAYGISFAIYGLAAAGRHLGDAEALDAALRAFDYLERVHRDPVHGGYFEVSVEGRAKTSGEGRCAIGALYGQKSQNTHLHLMEAFTELFRARPDPLVRERLAETAGILAGRLFRDGHLTLFAHADWSPASTEVSYGHDIEAAHLMLDAMEALGATPPGSRVSGGLSGGLRPPATFLDLSGVEQADARRVAEALGDATLAEGWDEENGGIFYAGTAEGPTDRTKNWWAQAEALLGFAALWRHTGEARYRDALAQTWAFIREHQIDRERGGWFEEAGRPEMPKGHAWKAAYHDGRALLFTARLLRAMGEGQ